MGDGRGMPGRAPCHSSSRATVPKGELRAAAVIEEMSARLQRLGDDNTYPGWLRSEAAEALRDLRRRVGNWQP